MSISINVLVENNVNGDYDITIIRMEKCLSHVQKRIRIHWWKNKEFIASQKTLMQHEMSICKNEGQKRLIREKYKLTTLRDLKRGKENWGDNVAQTENSKNQKHNGFR